MRFFFSLLLTFAVFTTFADELAVRRNGSTLTVEASTDFQHWDVVTNLSSDEPQKFFRSTATNPVPLNFLYEPHDFRPIPFSSTYYYQETATPLIDTYYLQDSNHIRIYKALDGKLYDHATILSEYAMALYDGYLKTTNSAYLDRMEAYAQRLLSMKVESRGAWFFQDDFPMSIKYPEIIYPPAWGSIGQGNALSVFIHLYELTSKPMYLEAIQKTYASYKLPAAEPGVPFITEMDSDGYLWFEEYATIPDRAEYVFNGHIFGIFGLYDYYMFSHDPDAARLLEGALLTVKHYFPFFRTPGWALKYSRRTPVLNVNYPAPVSKQLGILYSMTADTFFASAAEQLIEDYPYPQNCRCMLNGALNGYQFDASGSITNRTNYVFASQVVYWGDIRTRILNQPGIWIKPLNGPMAGFYVREYPDQAAMSCIIQPLTFNPPRKLTLSKNQAKYTFTKYTGPYASVVDQVTRSYTDDQVLQFDQEANVVGQKAVRIASGDLAGYWVPVTIFTTFD